MPIISVKPGNLAQRLTTDWAAMRARVIRAVQVEVHTSGLAIVDDTIARSHPVPVDRGLYRRSWRVAELPDGASLFNDSPYASIIENGRRPGSKPPPRQPIFDWIMRKGLARLNGPTQRRAGRRMKADERSRAWGLAFVIARSIGKHGQPARLILAKTREFLDVKVAKAAERAMLGGP